MSADERGIETHYNDIVHLNIEEANMPKLYTVKEAKDELRVSQSMIYQLIDEGRLKAIRIGGKGRRGCIRISEAALNDFLKRCCENSGS